MRLLVCGVAEQRSMPLGGERKERRQPGEEAALVQPAFPRSAGRSLWVSSGSYGPHGRDLGRWRCSSARLWAVPASSGGETCPRSVEQELEEDQVHHQRRGPQSMSLQGGSLGGKLKQDVEELQVSCIRDLGMANPSQGPSRNYICIWTIFGTIVGLTIGSLTQVRSSRNSSIRALPLPSSSSRR